VIEAACSARSSRSRSTPRGPRRCRRCSRAATSPCRIAVASSARLDLDPRGIAELIRASVHYFNTESEVDLLVETVRDLTGV